MWLCHMCFSIILWVLSHHLLWGSLNQVSFGIISSILLTGQVKLPRDHAFSWWQSSSVCRWKGQMLVMKWDFLLLWLQCNVSEIQIRVSHQSFLILPSPRNINWQELIKCLHTCTETKHHTRATSFRARHTKQILQQQRNTALSLKIQAAQSHPKTIDIS